ncbi:Uu.00g079890.m01.CDS01 [Anthostomella pinea]|uniref:Uu.00g079890.m01.CDS01 n=1 Tax=Anthostomella pinea TaxID=933095 RepID=A0AAI8VFH9_9PEZI|nr:Uu.00g079890.m01.CDS01 [Anthostomella pinea]
MHLRELLVHLAIAAVCDASSRYVKLPVVHSINRKVFGDVWDKRAMTTVPLANRSDVAYYAKLDIGTPPQQVYLQLDTGSFELWVNPECARLQDSSDVWFCQAAGYYNVTSSSTATTLAGNKTLQYGVGSASIQYVQDDIGLSDTDTSLKGVQFGVALDTVDEWSGILGIGYGENVNTPYKNFIDQLADQGVTDTKAFSLALGSKAEEEGIVIFGGIDTGKFTGTLQTLPVIPAEDLPDQVPRYWVNMSSLSLTPPSGNTKVYQNTTMAVFLDSGTTLTLLPTDLANTIAADFGAEAADSHGVYSVDCSRKDLPGTLDFGFEGVTIRVPCKELVRELQTVSPPQCFLGISPNDDYALLGDTMLRSAYVVFDQTNNAIHLAQYVNCNKNEMEITDQTNMSSITGDCDAPDFNTANTTSGTSPTTTATTDGGNGGAAETDASNASAAPLIRSSSHTWLGYWTALLFVTIWVGAFA